MKCQFQSYTQAEDTVAITPRNIRFPLETVAQRNWFAGNAVMTAYCDALSVLFPKGERFFIRAVRSNENKIKDQKLRDEIRDFCIQEAYHTREHEAYNQRLIDEGLDFLAMEARVDNTLGRVRRPITQLAVTVAIEHLTATLAHVILSDPKLLEKAAPPFRDLWTWHSLEEMEHKGVAYDVFLEATKGLSRWQSYLLRCTSMFAVTLDLHRIQLVHFAAIMRHRGEQTGLRMWARAFWELFGFPGYYRRALRNYLRIYLPGFHPWKGDDGSLAREGRAHFEQFSAVSLNDTDKKSNCDVR